MVTFVDYFHIDPDDFAKTYAFNPNLDGDSNLYIDPKLIKSCSIEEFINSSNVIESYFSKILRLVRLSRYENDAAWNAAVKLLHFKEMPGTCIGYSNSGTSGNSVGSIYSEKMMKLAKEITDLGMEDPIIFEVATMFQKGIGCDRISDIITNILRKPILEYSSRIVSTLGLNCNFIISEDDVKYHLVLNPFNNEPILFVPFSVLSKLPISESFSDIETVCKVNQINRDELSKYVHFDNRRGRIPKGNLAYPFLHDSHFRALIMNVYTNVDAQIADSNLFKSRVKKEFCLPEQQYDVQSTKELIDFVRTINTVFKDFVENKGVNKLFFHKGVPLDEKHVQLAYRLVAEMMCANANVDLSEETNNGRGPVDFKMSRGYKTKVLVEIKLSSNSRLIQGLSRQLPEYMKSEDACYGFYFVMDLANKGFSVIQNQYNEIQKTRDDIELCLVDGNNKPSASKL